MIKFAVAAVLSGTVVSCGNTGSPHQSSNSADPTLTGSFEFICNYLASTDALKRADELAAQGSGPSSGEVADVCADLQRVADVAPSVMQTALHNILNQLGTESTPQVVPDSRLLAGECRARNLSIPLTE
jgi:hypothetical protein